MPSPPPAVRRTVPVDRDASRDAPPRRLGRGRSPLIQARRGPVPTRGRPRRRATLDLVPLGEDRVNFRVCRAPLRARRGVRGEGGRDAERRDDRRERADRAPPRRPRVECAARRVESASPRRRRVERARRADEARERATCSAHRLCPPRACGSPLSSVLCCSLPASAKNRAPRVPPQCAVKTCQDVRATTTLRQRVPGPAPLQWRSAHVHTNVCGARGSRRRGQASSRPR